MKDSLGNQVIPNYIRLAQSASALGAGILGFGLGVQFGTNLKSIAIIIIGVGAVLHTYGMYIVQLKNQNLRNEGIAKVLYISAWVCLIVLVGIAIYMLNQ